jgi:phosphoglycolate phosphatase
MQMLIVFDCDGTLVDSQHMIVEGMRRAFAAVGLPAPERAAMLRQVGLSVPEAMRAMVGEAEDALIVALAREYRAAFSELRRSETIADPLFDGAREAIEALVRRDDVLLGVATGKSRRGVTALLDREGFARHFVTLQTADDAPSKPHPAMLLQAMRETGIGPDRTVMIGDTSYDMLMARAARAEAIGVAWGYHEPEELFAAGAVEIAENFAFLQDSLIARLRKIAI